MLELEENLRVLKELLAKLNSLKEALKISSLQLELEKLREVSSQEGFWENSEQSSQVFSQMKKLERKIESFYLFEKTVNDLLSMNELLTAEYDEELEIEM